MVCLLYQFFVTWSEQKTLFFATQYSSQVISGARAAEKDERPATKERMWFLLWSWGVMGE